jgi:hypothetical protein
MSSIEELTKFADVLAGVKELFVAPASKAIAKGLEAVKEAAMVVPPQPARDRAKTFNTYVREEGNYPRSAFVENEKAPGGYSLTKKVRGGFRPTSQRMHTKFKTKVEPGPDGVEGMVKNLADYSGYVIGWESDDPKQVGFHAETGWPSSDEALEKAMPVIEKAVDEAIDDVLRKLAS